jgi:hypothetical protein
MNTSPVAHLKVSYDIRVRSTIESEWMACKRRAECARLNKGNFSKKDQRASESWKCGQGWQTSHEALQKFSIDVCNDNEFFSKVHIMLIRLLRPFV